MAGFSNGNFVILNIEEPRQFSKVGTNEIGDIGVEMNIYVAASQIPLSCVGQNSFRTPCLQHQTANISSFALQTLSERKETRPKTNKLYGPMNR